ncbi:hypothetical protein RJ641_011297 [Dillenia turbinata]|uniref:Uncharacterized protein n=1 Tax=Dillenia turbinata TaxID=194707 RepID=A0AAN8V840_9MAGN
MKMISFVNLQLRKRPRETLIPCEYSGLYVTLLLMLSFSSLILVPPYSPSFNLLEEELGEGISNEIVSQVTDDAQAVETDEEDCKITTEKTVFDNIHRKAKSFPVLASVDIPASPSSQAMILTSKRTCEKQLESHDSTKILEETEKHRESPGKVVAPTLDLGVKGNNFPSSPAPAPKVLKMTPAESFLESQFFFNNEMDKPQIPLLEPLGNVSVRELQTTVLSQKRETWEADHMVMLSKPKVLFLCLQEKI